MFKSNADIHHILGDFKIESRIFRYSSFVPRLYNYCKSLGFEPGKIMPSRAFCSDENQGFPIILISKHFGIFPFNHGQVGGIVATDRHGPHAEHGKDMLMIQASHVGYDPETKEFGTYRRICTEHKDISASCGKIDHVLSWYEEEYQFAINNIMVQKVGANTHIFIDNQLLDTERSEGLILDLDRLIEYENNQLHPIDSLCTSKSFRLKAELADKIQVTDERRSIGKDLRPEYFHFRRKIQGDIEGFGHLDRNLLNVMQWVVSSGSPLLVAAMINTQVEFDRAYRTIVKAPGYRNKRLIFIAGLNIDISPREGELFPITKFVPWAAYIQKQDGTHMTMEQEELYNLLRAQSEDNPDEIKMDEAIQIMEDAQEVILKMPD